MGVAPVLAEQGRGVPERQVRLLGHRKIRVRGIQRTGVRGAGLGGAQREPGCLRHLLGGDDLLAEQPPQRRVRRPEPGVENHLGEAVSQTAGTWRATSTGLKL